MGPTPTMGSTSQGGLLACFAACFAPQKVDGGIPSRPAQCPVEPHPGPAAQGEQVSQLLPLPLLHNPANGYVADPDSPFSGEALSHSHYSSSNHAYTTPGHSSYNRASLPSPSQSFTSRTHDFLALLQDAGEELPLTPSVSNRRSSFLNKEALSAASGSVDVKKLIGNREVNLKSGLLGQVEDIVADLNALKPIGQGANGAVYTAIFGGATVAVKFVSCARLDFDSGAVYEALVSRDLEHPNVCRTISTRVAHIDRDKYRTLLAPSRQGTGNSSTMLRSSSVHRTGSFSQTTLSCAPAVAGNELTIASGGTKRLPATMLGLNPSAGLNGAGSPAQGSSGLTSHGMVRFTASNLMTSGNAGMLITSHTMLHSATTGTRSQWQYSSVHGSTGQLITCHSGSAVAATPTASMTTATMTTTTSMTTTVMMHTGTANSHMGTAHNLSGLSPFTTQQSKVLAFAANAVAHQHQQHQVQHQHQHHAPHGTSDSNVLSDSTLCTPDVSVECPSSSLSSAQHHQHLQQHQHHLQQPRNIPGSNARRIGGGGGGISGMAASESHPALGSLTSGATGISFSSSPSIRPVSAIAGMVGAVYMVPEMNTPPGSSNGSGSEAGGRVASAVDSRVPPAATTQTGAVGEAEAAASGSLGRVTTTSNNNCGSRVSRRMTAREFVMSECTEPQVGPSLSISASDHVVVDGHAPPPFRPTGAIAMAAAAANAVQPSAVVPLAVVVPSSSSNAAISSSASMRQQTLAQMHPSSNPSFAFPHQSVRPVSLQGQQHQQVPEGSVIAEPDSGLGLLLGGGTPPLMLGAPSESQLLLRTTAPQQHFQVPLEKVPDTVDEDMTISMSSAASGMPKQRPRALQDLETASGSVGSHGGSKRFMRADVQMAQSAVNAEAMQRGANMASGAVGSTLDSVCDVSLLAAPHHSTTPRHSGVPRRRHSDSGTLPNSGGVTGLDGIGIDSETAVPQHDVGGAIRNAALARAASSALRDAASGSISLASTSANDECFMSPLCTQHLYGDSITVNSEGNGMSSNNLSGERARLAGAGGAGAGSGLPGASGSPRPSGHRTPPLRSKTCYKPQKWTTAGSNLGPLGRTTSMRNLSTSRISVRQATDMLLDIIAPLTPPTYVVAVVMEYCNMGDLDSFSRKDPFNPSHPVTGATATRALLHIAMDVAQGMAYLHSLSLVHGDLKPGNVLLHRLPGRKGVVAKVSDFGMLRLSQHNELKKAASSNAKSQRDQQQQQQQQLPQLPSPMGSFTTSFSATAGGGNGNGVGVGVGGGAGTPGTPGTPTGTSGAASRASSKAQHDSLLSMSLVSRSHAPIAEEEGQQGQHSSNSACMGTVVYSAPEHIIDRQATNQTDVYSYGITLWQMAAGMRPFEELNAAELLFQISCKGLKPAWPEGRHMHLKDLYERCTASDPKDRPSFDEVVSLVHQIKVALAAQQPQNAPPLQHPPGSPSSVGGGGLGSKGVARSRLKSSMRSSLSFTMNSASNSASASASAGLGPAAAEAAAAAATAAAAAAAAAGPSSLSLMMMMRASGGGAVKSGPAGAMMMITASGSCDRQPYSSLSVKTAGAGAGAGATGDFSLHSGTQSSRTSQAQN